MTALLTLAMRSAWNRRFVLALVVAYRWRTRGPYRGDEAKQLLLVLLLIGAAPVVYR